MRGSGGKWKMLESVLKQSIEDEGSLLARIRNAILFFPRFFRR